MKQLLPILLLLAIISSTFQEAESRSTYEICSRLMTAPGIGLANQDVLGAESENACLKNLHMFQWWPRELPMWARQQWCSETIKHEVVVNKTFPVSNVKGKRIIVTGGDTGLGFATMKALAQSGADVSYTSRNCDCDSNPYSTQWPQQCEELAQLRTAVAATFNFPLKCYTLDLLDGLSVASFIQAVKVDFKDGLDVLMNNAGLVDTRAPGAIFNCNFLGAYAVTKGLWEVLLISATQGRDVRVVMTSSVERLVINQRMATSAYAFFDEPGSSYAAALQKAEDYIKLAVSLTQAPTSSPSATRSPSSRTSSSPRCCAVSPPAPPPPPATSPSSPPTRARAIR